MRTIARLELEIMVLVSNEDCDMLQNVGSVDRVIRVVAGVAPIGASLLGAIGRWGWIVVVPLATGLFRFCPADMPFGLSTTAAKTGTTSR